MEFIGIDIGSTYTKYCIMSEGGVICQLYSEKTPVRQRAYFEERCREFDRKYPQAILVSCGYGKGNIAACKNVNELTALARGANYAVPDAEVILDIGGQDTKVICQKEGKLQEFFVNDRCAAGSGVFLANTVNMLNISFDKIDLTGTAKPEIDLSSVCAVFAQTEIVELIAKNTDENAILQAVIWQILVQSRRLLCKVKDTPVLLSGGLAQIKGILEYAEHALDRQCMLSEYGAYLSAIGCALISSAGMDKTERG